MVGMRSRRAAGELAEASAAGHEDLAWCGRSAPPDSVRLMMGRRFCGADLHGARRSSHGRSGLIAPPLHRRLVGGDHALDARDDADAADDAARPGANSVPQAASGAISRKGESRSSSSSMRSRAMSLPRCEVARDVLLAAALVAPARAARSGRRSARGRPRGWPGRSRSGCRRGCAEPPTRDPAQKPSILAR